MGRLLRRVGAVAALTLTLAAPLPAVAAPAFSGGPVWVTLGTGGGPRVQANRAQPANALIVGDAVYLFDTGDGVLRQLAAAALPVRRLRAVFLSHPHLDHVAGLGPLLANRWLLDTPARLPVIGPPGTAAMTAGLAAALRPVELAPITIGGPTKPPLAASIDARDLPGTLREPAEIYADEHIRVLAVENDHFHFAANSPEATASRSYAFRVEAGGRSIVFTGDTGPSPRLVALAKGADLLVSEVIDLPAMERILKTVPGAPVAAAVAHMRADHLTPAQVGELAAAARVKAVVLTHFVPGVDAETDLAGYTIGLADRYAGPVRLARDLDRFVP